MYPVSLSFSDELGGSAVIVSGALLEAAGAACADPEPVITDSTCPAISFMPLT
jgi:hypothetical protein